MKSIFKGATEKERKLYTKCITKFFMERLPYLTKLSDNEVFVKLFGDIRKLGVEGALEACIDLFKDGSLQMQAKSSKDFLVYIYDEGSEELLILYDTDKEKK